MDKEACLFQEAPVVAVGYVVHAPVFGVRIVQTHPASQVSHRGGPSPVRVVLMPGYHAAVLGWLAEELVVKEPEARAQQLVGRHAKGRIP